MNLANYWAGGSAPRLARSARCAHPQPHAHPDARAGLWRSQWVLETRDGGGSGELSGSITCNVHYFEDGNVQLDDGTKFSATVPLQVRAPRLWRREVLARRQPRLSAAGRCWRRLLQASRRF